MLWVDHVLLGVRDLEAAAGRLLEEHGLVALAGGVPGAGLRNRIVPLAPPQYLELIALDGRWSGDENGNRRWLREGTASGDRIIWWAVGTDEIDAVAARTGRAAVAGRALEEAGSMRGGWRSIWPPGGGASGMPFFIEYETDPTKQRALRQQGYARAASPAKPGVILEIETGGDEAAMRAWLGAELPLRFVEGAPGVHAVRMASARGDIVIR